jgi:putative ABC transport system permease protein
MTARPPRLARWLLRVVVPSSLRHELLHDLAERYAALVRTDGRPAARRWYRRQVRRFLFEGVARLPQHAFSRKRRPEHRTSRIAWTRGLRQDLVLAFRSLRRSPGFAFAAVSVLTLGIGGTTAVFSVMNGILLRPLPYAEPDGLVVTWTFNERQRLPDGTSYLNARDWLERSQTLADLALFIRPEFTTATVTDFGQPDRIHVGMVTWNFFSLLGVDAVAGRTFQAADLTGDHNLIVVNESYWKQQLAGSTDVIGSTLQLDGERYEIVGVVPSTVRLPRPTTMIWLLHDPAGVSMRMASRRNDSYVVLARLRPTVTVAAAQAELHDIAAELAAEFPETNRDLGVEVRPLLAEMTGERLPFVLKTLVAAVLLVLLVAATNVSQLILARGARRQRELAIRSALGASRAVVIRQLAVEALVLGGLAVAGGIAVGSVGLRLLLAVIPPDVPRLHEVSIDGTVLLLTIAVAAMVAPLFALLPSLSVSRQDLAIWLGHGGRGASNRQRALRRVLVTSEVAIAVVLLTEAGLLIRSARAVQGEDPGFDARALLVAQVDLDPVRYSDLTRVQQFADELLPRVRALPGVAGAGIIDDFFIRRFPDIQIKAEGQGPVGPDDLAPKVTGDGVSPGFFEAIGLPMLAGRDLQAADFRPGNAPPNVVVNRSMAETFWPGESAIGKRFWWGDQDPTEDLGASVVGVVPDMRRGRLEETPFPQIFTPSTPASMDLTIRTDGDPLTIVESVRRVLADIDPNVPLSQVGTAWSRFNDSLAERRLQGWLLSGFSGLAVLLAAIGLYALLYDAVTVRRREIGIRIALGAAPGAVRRLMLREGMQLVIVGLAIGMAGAMAASRLTESLLYGVSPGDLRTLAGVSVGFLLIATFASWIPAARATQVQPTETLGSE